MTHLRSIAHAISRISSSCISNVTSNIMTMRASAAVFLLWGSTASGFTTPAVPSYGVVARGMAPLNAVESNNDNVAAAPVWATPVATAALAASLLLSPLPVDARTAPVEPASTVSTISPEQKAIASAKSALDEATAKYNAAMKTVSQDQAADSKAQQAVAAAEKNVEKARKSFITANDKLAAARSNGNAALADTQAKLAGTSLVYTCNNEYAVLWLLRATVVLV